MIARYEEIVSLDPGVFWDWVELKRLYRDIGRLTDAERAARKAISTAGSSRDRSVAYNEMGDVQRDQGNLDDALKSYHASLDIRERLAAADPGNANWQRALWVSMWRLALSGSGLVTWAEVVAKMEEMERNGTLLPTDKPYLEAARRHAAAASE